AVSSVRDYTKAFARLGASWAARTLPTENTLHIINGPASAAIRFGPDQGRSPRLLGKPRPGLRRLRTRPPQPERRRPTAARKGLGRGGALRQDGEGQRPRGPEDRGRERRLCGLP